MTKKLAVTIADVVNRTPAYQRCLDEPERYELTEDALEYLDSKSDRLAQTIGRSIRHMNLKG